MATAISPAKSAGITLPVPDYNGLPSIMNGMDVALWTLEQEPRTVPKGRLRVAQDASPISVNLRLAFAIGLFYARVR